MIEFNYTEIAGSGHAIINSNEQLLRQFNEVCTNISQTQPIIYVCVALIMDILEPYVMIKFLNNKTLWERKFMTKSSWSLNIKYNDILFMYRLTKKMCLVMALSYIILQGGIFG